MDGVILFAAPFFGYVVSLPDELGRYRIHDRNDSGVGGALAPDLIQRDIDRFVARTDHLRHVLRRYRAGDELVAARETFYFRERCLHFKVASGERPMLKDLPALLRGLAREGLPGRRMIMMAIFLFLATALPNRGARAALAYRLKAGQRSTIGFVKQMISRRY